MAKRKKILILEHDEFLREILGNLLHKKDYFILNGVNINQGIEKTQKVHIDYIILGTSCLDFKGRSSFSYIHKYHPKVKIFSINADNKFHKHLEKSDQMLLSELSVKKTLARFF